MLYWAEGYTNDKATLRVEITTGGDASERKELTLLSGGVVIDWSGGEDVLRTMRKGGATISVRTADDLSDLWSGKAMDVPVKIMKDSAVIWMGYVMPNQWSQPVKSHQREVQIECRDLVSVLQDVAYTSEVGNDVPTMLDYVVRALKAAGGATLGMRLVYIEPWSDATLATLAVMDANWWDESGEAMKWSEVLDGILTYNCLQLTQIRGVFYLLDPRLYNDYTSILNYTTYNLATGATGSVGKQTRVIDLDEVSADEVPTLSLTETVRKVKAQVSLYSESNVLPNWWDDDTVLGGQESLNHIKYNYKDFKTSEYSTKFGFYSHPQVTLKAYNPVTMIGVTHEDSVAAMGTKCGGWLVKECTKGATTDGRDPFGSTAGVGSVNNDAEMKKWIMLARHDNAYAEGSATLTPGLSATYEGAPMVTLTDGISRIYTGCYLVISGKVRLSCDKKPILNPDKSNQWEEEKTVAVFGDIVERVGVSCEIDELYLDLEIKVGDKWLSQNTPSGWGTAATVSDTPAIVRCYLTESDGYRANNTDFFNKDLPIRNNVQWYYGIDGQGTALMPSAPLAGVMSVTIRGIHTPHWPDSKNNGSAIPTNYAWISDLKVTVARAQGATALVKTDADVEYENVVDDDNVGKDATVKMIVGTDVGREYSRGAVIALSGTNMSYAQELTSAVTGERAIAEHHLIARAVNQYKMPRKHLQSVWRMDIAYMTEVIMSTDLGAYFVVSAAKWDVLDNKTEMTLEEVAK